MILYLNDGKVAKKFGCHPERGRPLPIAGKKRVTVGVRWSLPKLDYEPDDDVLVKPFIALRFIAKGKWKLEVAPEYRELAVNWLVDNCQ